MKNISFLLILLLFLGCKNTENLFISPEVNLKTIKISSIQIDSLSLSSIDASYVGNLGIIDDSLYFVDSKFCWLFLFDKQGNFIKRELGQGRSSNEIPTNEICGYGCFDDYWLFIGSGNDCHLYDRGLNLIKSYGIEKGRRDTLLSYKTPSLYTLSYNNLTVKKYNQMIYMNIYSEAPKLNFIENSKSYFNESKILFKMDFSTGKVIDLLGGYPPLYADKSESTRLYSNVNYDINQNNGDFYVSYEADSLIYCYDKNYKIKSSFGIQGINMYMRYPQLMGNDFIKKYYTERTLYAHYTSLKYLPEADILIRTYNRGEKHSHDGMQIYENQVLIGDLNVPKNFNIIGYIKPYIYAYCGIDEYNEQIKLYKLYYKK